MADPQAKPQFDPNAPMSDVPTGAPTAQAAPSAQPVFDPNAPMSDLSSNPTPTGASPSFWDSVKQWAFPKGIHPPADAKQAAKQEFQKKETVGTTEGAGMLGGLAEWDKASGGEIGGGVGDILQGNVTKGLHRILGGTGHAMTPALPLLAPAMVSAPLATGLAIGGGVVGSKAAKAAAEGLGATPDQSALAGDIGGFAGGYGGGKIAQVVPNVLSRALLLGKTPAEAYQSALKPSTALPLPQVQSAVQTGLREGIPVSEGGLDKIGDLLEDLQGKVSDVIQTDPTRPINPLAVAQRLDPTYTQFANQVNPEADLAAIQGSEQEFLNRNPSLTAEQAQKMKVGTYQSLGKKAYGELKGAQIEAQKGLARGLKEELANAFPELSDLNARESQLYDLQPVLERAIKRIDNHQIMGIGTPVVGAGAKALGASNKLAGAAALFKMILDNPNVKSRLAIALAQRMTPAMANARIASFVGGLSAAASNTQPQSEKGAQFGSSF